MSAATTVFVEQGDVPFASLLPMKDDPARIVIRLDALNHSVVLLRGHMTDADKDRWLESMIAQLQIARSALHLTAREVTL